MNNLEICKRIAEIEGIEYFSSEGIISTQNKLGMCREYNPLTDDALCFRLMIKYKIELGFYGAWYGCFQGKKPVGSDGCLSYELSARRAICLAIIEAHT